MDPQMAMMLQALQGNQGAQGQPPPQNFPPMAPVDGLSAPKPTIAATQQASLGSPQQPQQNPMMDALFSGMQPTG